MTLLQEKGRVLSKENETLLDSIKSGIEALLAKVRTTLTTEDDVETTESDLSVSDLTARLERALRASTNIGKDQYVYIRDVFDTYFVYSGSYSGSYGHFAVTYTLDDSGTISLGTTTEVISHTTYDTLDGKPYPDTATAVSEAEIDLTSDIIPLIETDLKEASTRRVKLIAPGKGSSGFYPAAVLKRDGPNIFKKGLKMYWDHQTADEEKNRPEGSLDRLAAVLESNAEWQDDGLYAKVKVYDHYATRLKELAPDIGVSIRATGKARMQQIDGINTPVVEAITRAKSVDFVTTPGAGGKVLELFEAAKTVQPVIMEDTPMADIDVSALEAQITAQNTQIARLNEAIAVATAQTAITNRLKSVALPQATKERLTTQLITAVKLTESGTLDTVALTTNIDNAVKDEAAYLQRLIGSGVKLGNNASVISTGNGETDIAKLTEAATAAIKAL